VQDTFSEEIRFRSPYADYRGRADVAHLVSLISEVLVDVEPVRRVHEQDATISLFDAPVERDPARSPGSVCDLRDRGDAAPSRRSDACPPATAGGVGISSVLWDAPRATHRFPTRARPAS
jgi:hypothetical protein